MEAFSKKGYRVVVVATVLSGFDVERTVPEGVEFVDWSIKKAGMNPFADIGALWRLWVLLTQIRPHIVFSHTAKAVILGLIVSYCRGVPRRTAMIPGLGYAFAEGSGARRRIARAIATWGYRAALSNAHTVIFQNEDDRQRLISLGVLRKSVPSFIVRGSGIDMERFPDAPHPPGPPVFLMVARLLKDKGVYEFVAAARKVKCKVPEARFVLVGGGDANPSSVSQSEVEEWVREGVVEARGHLENTQPEYAACHVFVLPSYYMEGCPRVNLEAMSTGRAIITTDWVGCRETVRHGENGILVAPRDVDALAGAMLAIALIRPL